MNAILMLWYAILFRKRKTVPAPSGNAAYFIPIFIDKKENKSFMQKCNPYVRDLLKVLMVSGEYPPMKGGISRYTANLVGALVQKVQVDVATNASLKGIDRADHIHPVIIKGDRGNSDRLLKLVSELKPDVVNVQYERGLYEIDTPQHMMSNILFGSTLDKFYKECSAPTVSTIHTIYPYDEYRDYIRHRAARKAGRLAMLPRWLRVALRTKIMEYRYRLLLHVANLSYEIISPARTIRDIVGRGAVIYHGAEPAGAADLSVGNRDNLRKEFGLPADSMLLLAFGYAGFYKGFDLLEGLDLPEGWMVVTKQDRHERGAELPVQIDNAINLRLGYLDDEVLSKLFLACDAIVFPYQVVSVSGVMFDALAHGLPFVASDLAFFREFAEMGLGAVSKRDRESFARSISHVAQNYPQYRKNVLQFRPALKWDHIAELHIQLYLRIIKQHAESITS